MKDLEGQLIEYIDGNLQEAERLDVEAELASNPEARKMLEQLQIVMTAMKKSGELEPGKKLQKTFEAALREEMESVNNRASTGKQLFFRPTIFRAAAAVAILISGIGIGYWINKNQQHEADLMAIRKEVEATKQMMMAMLDNRESASQRVIGATVAFKMEKADDQIVGALSRAMNEDPNTNVRLAALEALGKFRQQDHVRRVLIASLATQKDPIIQIALIRLMVEMKEKDAVKELERITNDEVVLPAVKDEAHAGLLKLS